MWVGEGAGCHWPATRRVYLFLFSPRLSVSLVHCIRFLHSYLLYVSRSLIAACSLSYLLACWVLRPARWGCVLDVMSWSPWRKRAKEGGFEIRGKYTQVIVPYPERAEESYRGVQPRATESSDLPSPPRITWGLGRSEIATESTRRTALEGLAGASSQLTFGELYEPPIHPLFFSAPENWARSTRRRRNAGQGRYARRRCGEACRDGMFGTCEACMHACAVCTVLTYMKQGPDWAW